MVTDNTKVLYGSQPTFTHTFEDVTVNIPLTSYVARYSWATTAKDEGVAISVISESFRTYF